MISWIFNLFHIHRWKYGKTYDQKVVYYNEFYPYELKYTTSYIAQIKTCEKCGKSTRVRV